MRCGNRAVPNSVSCHFCDIAIRLSRFWVRIAVTFLSWILSSELSGAHNLRRDVQAWDTITLVSIICKYCLLKGTLSDNFIYLLSSLTSAFWLFRCIGPFLFCAVCESGFLTFNVVSFSWYLFCQGVLGSSGGHVFVEDPVKWIYCARELKASNLKNRDCSFHQLQTLFVEGNIVRQLDLRFLSVWLISCGGQKLKTSAVNVERQRRKNYLRISAKIVAIRNLPLFF